MKIIKYLILNSHLNSINNVAIHQIKLHNKFNNPYKFKFIYKKENYSILIFNQNLSIG